MKKLLCLFGTSLFLFASCSKDNASSAPPSLSNVAAVARDTTVLVKQLISNGSDGARVTKFNYVGNKIVSAVNQDGSKINYIYKADLISEIDEINAKGILNESTTFIYANGKLVYEISGSIVDINKKIRYEYTYNTDNTITYKLVEIDAVTGAAIDSNQYGIGKYTFMDGNLVADEYSFFSNGVVLAESVYSNTYEYDTKNNPFYNIIGYRLLLGNINSTNNLISVGSVQSSQSNHSSNSFVYNVNGFPILGTDQSGAMTQYIY